MTMDTEIRSMFAESYVKIFIDPIPNKEFIFSLGGDISVDWGDGDIDVAHTGGSYKEFSKTYATAGKRTVVVSGNVRYIATDTNTHLISRTKDIEISGCPNLWRLSGVFPEMTNIDVSLFKDMQRLYLKGTKLKSVDLSGLDKLIMIDFSGSNQLSSVTLPVLAPSIDIINLKETSVSGFMDFSAFPALRLLYLSRTNIDGIDVSSCPKLFYLEADYTNISSMDLRSNPNLSRLSVVGLTGLVNLDLSGNKNITELSIAHSGISGIDLSGMSKLTLLSMASTTMVYVDISDCVNLKNFRGESCSLVGLTIPPTNSPVSVNLINCESLSYVNFNKSSLRDIYVSRSPLTQIDMDLEDCPNLNSVVMRPRNPDFILRLSSIVNSRAKYDLNKHFYNIPLIYADCKLSLRGAASGEIDSSDYKACIQFLANEVRRRGLYEYHQAFYNPGGITKADARAIYQDLKTLFFDCPILGVNDTSYHRGTPFQCFHGEHSVPNIPGPKEQKMEIVCKKNARFFCFPEQNSGYAYDLGYKFEYNNGAITKKNNAMKVSVSAVNSIENKITFWMKQKEPRSTWNACILESSYADGADTKIVSFNKV